MPDVFTVFLNKDDDDDDNGFKLTRLTYQRWNNRLRRKMKSKNIQNLKQDS